MIYTYLFEARGIQRFLFATGKLKDMLQGSEVIDYICAENGYLEQVLDKLQLQDKVQIPRQAGGAFYLSFDNQQDAQRFQATWRLLTSQWLPSLERVDVISQADTVKESVKQGLQLLAEQRNKVSIELPNTSPITERSPRTGLAASSRKYTDSQTKESIDLPTSVIRNFKRPDNSPQVTDRFLDNDSVYWPNNFEKEAREDKRFPLGRRRLVGLIHADGNGLGEVLRLLNEACSQDNTSDAQYVDLYRTFSIGVTNATIQAAKEATEQVLLPEVSKDNVIPARPLVLGGDDLSIIVRADLAVPFSKAFLQAFKKTSQEQIAQLKNKFEQYGMTEAAKKLPDCLTACAGIVFVKASQPFHQAYSLAEGLCKQAKLYSRQYKLSSDNGSDVKIIPSSLAFYKISDSVIEDVDSMIEQTTVIEHGNKIYRLTMPAYLVDDGSKADDSLVRLDQLLAIQTLLKTSSLNDRALRELATLLHHNLAQAKNAYRRWIEVSKRVQKTDDLESSQQVQQAKYIKQFETLLTQAIGELQKDLPFSKVDKKEDEYQSLIADLLTMISISEESPQVNSQNNNDEGMV